MPASELISSISKALDSSEAEERRQATARLSELDLSSALPLLARSLGDEDWRVRKEATIVARSFGPAQALVHALTDLLAVSDNIGLRNAVVDVLANIGPSATVIVAGALARLDADGRKLAVEVLGRSRDQMALDPLAAALHGDADDNVRQGAIEAIAKLGPLVRDRAEQLLLSALDDRDRLVRLTALEGLRSLEVAIPWPRLAPLLDDPALRPLALSAAALCESPEAVWALVRELDKAHGGAFELELAALWRLSLGPLAETVETALRAQGPLLGERLVALASGAGGTDNIELRRMALHLAAEARASGVTDVAISALSEELLTERAQGALKSIGQDALPKMISRLADANTPAATRAELVDIVVSVVERSLADETGDGLSSAERAALLDALRVAARDAERTVAPSALSALARLGDEGDFELLAHRTLAKDRPIALAAEGALSALASRYAAAARTRVREMLQGEAPALPAAILLGALANIGASEEGDAADLSQIAATGDVRARRAAVLAVSEIGGRIATEVLSVALADEERDVRLAAARALGRRSAIAGASSAGEILELIERTGTAELIAAAVRAIGEGVRHVYGDHGEHHGEASSLPSPPTPLAPQLFAKLAAFAGGAPSSLALAAVDALGYTLSAEPEAASKALAAALEHTDVAVVKAAMFKLPTDTYGQQSLLRCLAHPSPGVRTLAVEMLTDLPDAYDLLFQHASVEADPGVQSALDRALARSSRPSVRPSAFTLPPSERDPDRGPDSSSGESL